MIHIPVSQLAVVGPVQAQGIQPVEMMNNSRRRVQYC
jgi:hypothetical protein